MPDLNATPRALHDWIRKATFDLCDEPKARLYSEIEEHFLTAVEEATAQGIDRAAAETAALNSLGNPFDAGDAFNRSYLTLNDKEFIQQNLIPSRRHWRMVAIIILIMVITSILLDAFGFMPGVWLWLVEKITLILLVCSVSSYVDRVLTRHRDTSLRKRIGVNSLTWTLLGIIAILYDRWLHQEPFDPGFMVVLIIYWCRAWPIIRKLNDEPQLNLAHFRKGPDQHA